MPDLELEVLKRSVDLVKYARSMGYEDKPRDHIPGVTVLEHPRTHDRIAIARLEQGGIYARIADYHPRTPDESDDRARLRLRDCIARSKETGTVVEWVQHRERERGRAAPSPEQIREHLRAWQDVHAALERSGVAPQVPLARRIHDGVPAPSPSFPSEAQVQDRLRRWEDAQRALDLKLARAHGLEAPAVRPPTPAHDASERPDGSLSRSVRAIELGGRETAPSPQNELAQRRYDWSPPVGVDASAPARRRSGPERDR